MTLRRRLGYFLLFWLVLLTVFLTGLKSAWGTGQADPWCWSLAMLVAMIALGAAAGRSALWVAAGAVGMVLLFCGLASGFLPDPKAAIGLIALGLLAGFGGWQLRGGRWVTGVAAVGLSALLPWLGPARPIDVLPDRPQLAVMTGLPLFWNEGGRGRLTGPADAPIVTVLRTRFAVLPIDDPMALARTGARLLLLAQPRAPSPEHLVAIDTWVRACGTALVLADPLLRWPSDLALGDRRRAPVASHLGPLLSHWGFEPLAPLEEENRYLMPDGSLITMAGYQLFLKDGHRFLGPGDGAVLRKRIGRGNVLLLGDADLLDDRLWLADPALPLDPRAWSADTPARVVHWLGSGLPGTRHWLRQPQDVRMALRWALLFGTGWAILGAMLCKRNFLLSITGTKHENNLANTGETA